jgi:hypothetical protein
MSRFSMMNPLMSVLAMSLALSACSPKGDGSGAGTPVSTEWKEGYGGDSIALEAVHVIEQMCSNTKILRQDLLKRSMETKVEVSDSICDLLKPGQLVIESIKQPKVGGIDKDAANYPTARPRRLEIKAGYWTSLTTSAEARDKLVLHELLPLIGIEDTDYVRSTRLMIAIQTARRLAPEISCDPRRIEAVLSGADMDIARFVGRETGLLRCRSSIDVLTAYKPLKSDDENIRSETAQALAFGAFIGAVQSFDVVDLEQFEDFFIALIGSVPEALGNWSPGLCSQDGARDLPNSNICGGLMEFVFGATPEQKSLIVAKSNQTLDFDRATMNFLNRMVASPKLMAGFIEDGRINQALAKAAIRSQNWMPLMMLGAVHRALKLPGRASVVILQGISWPEILHDGAQIPRLPGDRGFRVDYNSCSTADIRSHAETTLDGGMPILRCEQARTI